jgi:hypothetical protein
MVYPTRWADGACSAIRKDFILYQDVNSSGVIFHVLNHSIQLLDKSQTRRRLQ